MSAAARPSLLRRHPVEGQEYFKLCQTFQGITWLHLIILYTCPFSLLLTVFLFKYWEVLSYIHIINFNVLKTHAIIWKKNYILVRSYILHSFLYWILLMPFTTFSQLCDAVYLDLDRDKIFLEYGENFYLCSSFTSYLTFYDTRRIQWRYSINLTAYVRPFRNFKEKREKKLI